MPTVGVTRSTTAQVVIAAVVVGAAGLGLTHSEPHAWSSSKPLAQSAIDTLTIDVPGKTIRIARSEWKPMKNEFEWADNFEQLTRGPRHEFARVVTVFKLPMSVDRRLGTKVSTYEYVEIFTGLSQTVTVRVRVDKGSYWVLSRETFRVPSSPSAEFYDSTLVEIISDRAIEDDEHALAHLALQPQIDSTRYLLQTRF